MSIFSTILAKLGFGKEAQAQATVPSTSAHSQTPAAMPPEASVPSVASASTPSAWST